MFRQVLEGILARIPEAQAVSLIGVDGISVDSINPAGLAIEQLNAEMADFFREIQLRNTELETGEIRQLALTTDRYIAYVTSMTSEYLLLMVMSPDGSRGRARYELKKARHALRDELI